MRQERLKKLNMRYQIHLDLVDIMRCSVLKSGGNKMKFDEVKELIAIFEKSDMGEMEIKLDGDSVHLGRNASFSVGNSETETVKTVIAGAESGMVSAAQTNGAVSNDTDINQTADVEKESVSADDKLVTAPIVGTYYQSQAPDKPPFVKVGDTVAKGDVVCIIEAMKFMNEVVSEVSGKIVEVLVEDGEFVEFGQPLFRVQ
ncbi:acetyl-CoA carboxylase biotin carboxyl carrier protein [Clostridium sp. AM27-31LB]|nr:acetyl-CoA carboxylase biotin carboxyl carrier protein [Clostridium sp. AM27-31LB]